VISILTPPITGNPEGVMRLDDSDSGAMVADGKCRVNKQLHPQDQAAPGVRSSRNDYILVVHQCRGMSGPPGWDDNSDAALADPGIPCRFPDH